MRTLRSLLICLLAVLPGAVHAQGNDPIVGMARVIDSDILAIGETRIILFGIESVEQGQFCNIRGARWDCFAAAVRMLETLTAVGEVACVPTGAVDAYRRVFAVCSVGDRDINAEMALSGFAVAKRIETDAYVAAEADARARGVGLWQGQFQNPTEFREAVGNLDPR